MLLSNGSEGETARLREELAENQLAMEEVKQGMLEKVQVLQEEHRKELHTIQEQHLEAATTDVEAAAQAGMETNQVDKASPDEAVRKLEAQMGAQTAEVRAKHLVQWLNVAFDCKVCICVLLFA
jgi:transcription elongation factor GreA-like protein